VERLALAVAHDPGDRIAVVISETPIISPGRKPAMKRSVIETPVMTP
jgi:hypothetical protein